MARPHSKIVCNKCNKNGFICKRPNKIPVQIPRNPAINTIPEACDYAARVYHRLRDMTILFPPSPSSLDQSDHNDESLAQLIYQDLSKYTLHTTEQIKAFETKHSTSPKKNITAMKARLTSDVKRTTEQRDDDYEPVNKLPKTDHTIHIKLPEDSGKITKTSIAYLYAAITWKIIGDSVRSISYIDPKYYKNYANAIYSYFRLFECDTRYSYPTAIWLLKILSDGDDEYDYYNNTVESKHQISIANDKTKMHLSNKHLHHKSKRIEQMLEDMTNSRVSYYFDSFMNGLQYINKNNPDLKENFHKRFQYYEAEAAKGNFLTTYNYYIGHSVDSHNDSNDNKHSRSVKKKWCPIEKQDLADIKISDEGYNVYEVLVNDMVKEFCEGNREKANEIHTSARNVLHDIGWPEDFIDDKMGANFVQVLVFNRSV